MKYVRRALPAGDPDAPPGTRDWALGLLHEIQSGLTSLHTSGRRLADLLRAMEQREAYRQLDGPNGQPFLTHQTFCQAPPPFGLGIPAAVIAQLIAEGITAEARVIKVAEARRYATQAVAQVTMEVASTGRPKKGTKQVPLSKGGNDRITAQIKDKRPDILDRMKAGEFPSVRQAALEAGIVKKRVSVETSALGFIRAAFAQLSPDERAQVIDGLGGQLKEDPNRGEAGPLPESLPERTRQGVLIGSDRADPAALAGPRMLKDPTSEDFAWQSARWLKTVYQSKEISEQKWQDALAEVDRYRIYERIPPGHPYGSLDALLEAEIGTNARGSIARADAGVAS